MARNVHNDFFQHFFQHAGVVAALLKKCLSQKILAHLDLATLVPAKTDFLPSRYRNSRRTDAFWSLRTYQGDRVGVHLEHQSSPNGFMVGRLLEYQAAFLKRTLQVNKGQKVPPVISIVVYHGAKPWKGPKSILEAFQNPELYFRSLQQNFLIDLVRTPIKELEAYEEAALPSILFSTQPSRNMCGILQEIVLLLKNCDDCCKEAAIEYMATVDKHGEDEFLIELSKFDEETANKYRIMFEYAIERTVKKVKREFLDLGLQQGRKEGIQLGRQEGMHNAIVGMYKAGVSVELISKGTGLAKEEIAKILQD